MNNIPAIDFSNRFASDTRVRRVVSGRQYAGHGEHNARAPRTMHKAQILESVCAGERDHVGRPSRHVAGLFLSASR